MDELPLYKCHKEVHAGKIKDIFGTPEGDGALYLDIGEPKTIPVKVSREYMIRHRPKRGGYYVRYEDGYESWSPAEAFEGGYTRVEG